MDFQFANRGNADLIKGISTVIQNYSSMIPNGVLVFFQSYKMMNNFVESWKAMKRPDLNTSVFEWMNETKPIFVEQSKKRENQEQIESYLKYAKTQKGSILMAVMNGKCSEGIDFSDHLNYWHFGFEALMITDTAFYRNKNYHEKGDKLETLDLKRMALVIEAVFEALRAKP